MVLCSLCQVLDRMALVGRVEHVFFAGLLLHIGWVFGHAADLVRGVWLQLLGIGAAANRAVVRLRLVALVQHVLTRIHAVLASCGRIRATFDEVRESRADIIGGLCTTRHLEETTSTIVILVGTTVLLVPGRLVGLRGRLLREDVMARLRIALQSRGCGTAVHACGE